ncbi:MAG: hypothetical protein ABIJ12_00425 [bacterium]
MAYCLYDKKHTLKLAYYKRCQIKNIRHWVFHLTNYRLDNDINRNLGIRLFGFALELRYNTFSEKKFAKKHPKMYADTVRMFNHKVRKEMEDKIIEIEPVNNDVEIPPQSAFHEKTLGTIVKYNQELQEENEMLKLKLRYKEIECQTVRGMYHDCYNNYKALKEESIEYLKKKLQGIVDSQKWCSKFSDNHIKADDLLLEYINDKEVTNLFEKIEKWYA